jgi:hypothetical protein
MPFTVIEQIVALLFTTALFLRGGSTAAVE